ncbi:hypothetical protein P879_06676, partial [Paragonimus westermani]
MEQNKECLINVSRCKFSLVVSGLTKMLQSIGGMPVYGPDAERNFCDSLLIVLETLEKCLTCQTRDTSRLDETILVKNVLQELFKVRNLVLNFMNLTSDNVKMYNQLINLVSQVLYALSTQYFNAVFNRISNCLALAAQDESSGDLASELELVQHLNLDMRKLARLIFEICNRFRSLKKPTWLHLAVYLERAIWNWLENYPQEFDDLQKKPSDELAECCERLFYLFSSLCAESGRKKLLVWPLQMMLLVLCPQILEEIINADNGAPLSPQHQKKKQFMDEVRKALSSHGHGSGSSKPVLIEAALLAAVNLCKASTFININDRNNTLFILVHSVYADLQNLLFNPTKPYIRSSQNVAETEALLTEFFVASFRITPHNNLLKVCLQTNSSAIYHTVLVSALYRIITQPRLPWWPDVSPFYSKSPEIRTMFLETLNRVNHHPPIRIAQSLTFRDKMNLRIKDKTEDNLMGKYNLLLNMVRLINANPLLMLYCPQTRPSPDAQKATFELMNGLMSLIQQSTMSELAQEAMDALLCLHQPANIRLWNLHSPAQAFWEISPQLLYSIAQNLLNRNIPNSCDVLKWLREILICRVNFLQQNCDCINIPGCLPDVTTKTDSLSTMTTMTMSAAIDTGQFESESSQSTNPYATASKETSAIRRQPGGGQQQFTAADVNTLLGPLGVNSKRNRMALIKLETVFFTYLWSLDLEAVLTSMSCFRLLCREAELWSNDVASAMVASLPEMDRNALLYGCDSCSNLTTTTLAMHRELKEWDFKNAGLLPTAPGSQLVSATQKNAESTRAPDLLGQLYLPQGVDSSADAARAQFHSSLTHLAPQTGNTTFEIDPRNRVSNFGSCIALCDCGCPLCAPSSYLSASANNTKAYTTTSTTSIASSCNLTDVRPTISVSTTLCRHQFELCPASSVKSSTSPTHMMMTKPGRSDTASTPRYRPPCCETSALRARSDCRLPDLLPVYCVYAEIADHSRSIVTTGRAHLQKQILNLLRKINHQTQGNKLAWEHTYMIWQRSTRFLINYPKSKVSASAGGTEDASYDSPGNHPPGNAGISGLNVSVGSSSVIGDSSSIVSELDSIAISGDGFTGLVRDKSGMSHNLGTNSGSLFGLTNHSINVCGLSSSSSLQAPNTMVGGSGSNVYGVSGSGVSNATRYLAVKRRSSQQPTASDHEIEDVLNEWANMTGFLCALGSVALNSTASQILPTHPVFQSTGCSHCCCDRRLWHQFARHSSSKPYQPDTTQSTWLSTTGAQTTFNETPTSYSACNPCFTDETGRRPSQQITSSTSTLSTTLDVDHRTPECSVDPDSVSEMLFDLDSPRGITSKQNNLFTESLKQIRDSKLQHHLSSSALNPTQTCTHQRHQLAQHHSYHPSPDRSSTVTRRYPTEHHGFPDSESRHACATVNPNLSSSGSGAKSALCLSDTDPLRSSKICPVHLFCTAEGPTRRMSLAQTTSFSQDHQFSPVAQYIGNLLSLISCQHEKFGHQIQKHVKEAIGNELNPLIYPILFDQLRAHVDACFSGQGQQQVVVTETNTLFVENVIFIMRSILDKRAGKSMDRQNGHLEMISIESLMLNIVRYVRHLECVHSLQIKIKVCQLVQKMMARREDLTFRREMRFRNKLVDYLCDWVMGSSYHLNLTTPSSHTSNLISGMGGPMTGLNSGVIGQGLNVQGQMELMSGGTSTHGQFSIIGPNGCVMSGISVHDLNALSGNLGPGYSFVFTGPASNTGFGTGNSSTVAGIPTSAQQTFPTPVNLVNPGSAIGYLEQTGSYTGVGADQLGLAYAPGHVWLGQTSVANTGPSFTMNAANSFAGPSNLLFFLTSSASVEGFNSQSGTQHVNDAIFAGHCAATTGTSTGLGATGHTMGLVSAVGPVGKLHTLPLLAGSIGLPTPVTSHQTQNPNSASQLSLSSTVALPASSTSDSMGTKLAPDPNATSAYNPLASAVAYNMAALGPNATGPAGLSIQTAMQTRELDLACMGAVAALLQGMPLQPEETDRGDLMDAKSHLFAKYFTLFMNLLNDVADDREKRPEVRQNNTALRNVTVQAMSNLLNANIESGLVHAIGLGYHRDPQSRAAFMEVLTKILQQGTEFETLAETALAERYERLIGLVTMIGENGELPIAMALSQVVQGANMDELAKVLVTLFDAKRLLYQLFWNVFSKELEAVDSMQTLLRGNTMTSKIMNYCFKQFGQDYLQSTLGPALMELVRRDAGGSGSLAESTCLESVAVYTGSEAVTGPNNYNQPQQQRISCVTKPSYEVDPRRLQPGENLEENQQNLIYATELLYGRLIASPESFPSRLQCMCSCLHKLISQLCFDNQIGQANTVLSTIVFLRFVNPAVVSPYESGLLDFEPPSRVKRCLTLVGKIMQNIANQLLFTKEPHMRVFDPLIQKHFDSCRHFFQVILQNSANYSDLPDSGVQSEGHAQPLLIGTETRLTPNTAPLLMTHSQLIKNVSSSSLSVANDHPAVVVVGGQLRADTCVSPVSAGTAAGGCSGVTGVTAFISDDIIHAVHRLLWVHLGKIGDYLASSRDRKAVGRQPFDRMVTLLAHLGPPEHKSVDSVWSYMETASNRLEDWVLRGYQFRDSEEFKRLKSLNVFYQAGTSRFGNPVFYYIARRYKSQEYQRVEYPLIICLVSVTLDAYRNKPFELVVDFTHASAENRFKNDLLSKWASIIGPVLREYLVAAYIYNCNSWVREYTKIHDRFFAPIKGSRKLIFIDHPTRLNEYIEPDQQRLPGGTLVLEEDLRVFNNALKLSHKDTKVAIKVCTNAIQVTSTEKSKVLGISVILNDVYYASEIEEVGSDDSFAYTAFVY